MLCLTPFSTLGPLCNRPMGMQSGRIHNSKITASSHWGVFYAAFRARLHHGKAGRFIGAWSAKTNNRYQFLQVNTKKKKIIVDK